MDVSKMSVVVAVLVVVVTALAGTVVYDQQVDYTNNCDDKYGEGNWELVSTGETAGLSSTYECVPKDNGDETDQAD